MGGERMVAAPEDLDEVIVIDVPNADAGIRLDVFLAERVRECSRTYVKRLISDGFVTLDNETTKPSHVTRSGETVIVTLPAEEEEDFEPFGEEIELPVVYEDVDIIVVDKPSSMPVHASRGHTQGTLVNALLGRGVELSDCGPRVRPGIVHRLDMDTSGCIVCARNNKTHKALQKQWRAREVVKEYLAIVHGAPRFEEGTIDRPLARDDRRRKRMAVRRDGKASLTQYRVEQGFPWYALVRAMPKTGRTHQVRVHMANMGHPILCDGLYGREQTATAGDLGGGEDDTVVIGRQALHAERLGFVHPSSGRWMDFKASMHADMERALGILSAG